MSPVDKSRHRGPHPAAAGGTRIEADLEARLAIEAQGQTTQRQMQRIPGGPAVHGTHAFPMCVGASWVLTAGPEATGEDGVLRRSPK